MNLTERPVSFNCPNCPSEMSHVSSTGAGADGVHVFECRDHGRWRLGPNDPDFRPMGRVIEFPFQPKTPIEAWNRRVWMDRLRAAR
jgi:hypothetical protein